MQKTPANFYQEFVGFVAELEATAGHANVVAQLIADSATYYKQNKELIEFCRKKGIIRLYAPPQTQSLNGLAERTIATLVEMAVAMLIDSGLPRRFYGEALMYAAYLLNRLPFSAGSKVTRLEMYKQKLLPNQHSRTHTFGCAAYRQLAHQLGKNVDKLDPKSELCIIKLLVKSGLGLAEPADTPLVPGKPLSSADCPSEAERLVLADERKWYLSTVASLIYFSHWTRPDMAYAVSKLCRFMHNPGKPHVTALKRTLRYLKGTANYGLLYDFGKSQSTANRKLGIYGLYDAAHADCPDTLKSTTAYMFFLAGGLISWYTKLHTYITTSTNHSEYCTAAKASREAKWLSMLASTIGYAHLASPINLFSDCKEPLSMSV
jgi:hypothetical protein